MLPVEIVSPCAGYSIPNIPQPYRGCNRLRCFQKKPAESLTVRRAWVRFPAGLSMLVVGGSHPGQTFAGPIINGSEAQLQLSVQGAPSQTLRQCLRTFLCCRAVPVQCPCSEHHAIFFVIAGLSVLSLWRWLQEASRKAASVRSYVLYSLWASTKLPHQRRACAVSA